MLLCVKCNLEIPLESKSKKYCSKRCSKNFLKAQYRRRNIEKIKKYNNGYRVSNPPLKNIKIKETAKLVYGKKCVRCRSNESLNVHHIVPLRNGGTNFQANLLILCFRCHMEWEKRMSGYWEE